eukprot:4811076-Pyramimonas_sp.AAC.1
MLERRTCGCCVRSSPSASRCGFCSPAVAVQRTHGAVQRRQGAVQMGEVGQERETGALARGCCTNNWRLVAD